MQSYTLFSLKPRIPFPREILAVSLMLAAIGPSAIACEDSEPERPTKARFVKHTFSPGSVARAGGKAILGQALNSPEEWGGGVVGFAKRFGSAFAGHVVRNSIRYPVAYFRHEALDYRPSEKHGFGPRLIYALQSSVITHKTTTGRRTVASGAISGTIGSGLISRLWQPASAHTVASGFSSAGISLGADAGMNVVREFWPRRRKSQGQGAVKDPPAPTSPR